LSGKNISWRNPAANRPAFERCAHRVSYRFVFGRIAYKNVVSHAPNLAIVPAPSKPTGRVNSGDELVPCVQPVGVHESWPGVGAVKGWQAYAPYVSDRSGESISGSVVRKTAC